MWMFVGLFTFKQLLGVREGQGGSFIQLLCAGSDQTVWMKSLSVVFIFIIVIIVMMKAIQYAMDNAAGKGVLSGVTQKVANKAGSYQKALTKDLYEKTKEKTITAGKYAASIPADLGKAGARILTTKASNGI